MSILILTLMFSSVILQSVTAQEIRDKTTYAYIGTIPDTVGINQPILLHVGISDYLAITSHGWENLTITVTKPDGTTETLGPFRTDSTGGTGTVYTPTMIGTYKFQTHFPEQLYTWNFPPAFSQNIFGTISYQASDSDILEVVVQDQNIEYYQGTPTPNEYWTRPIDAQHREWNTISGSWFERPSGRASGPVPYNADAPETAHILWEKPLLKMGGLAGGPLGDHAFECGDAYEGFFSNSIIVAGVLVYNQYKSGFPTIKVVAVDLHTGEELWNKELLNLDGDPLMVSFGQIFYFSSQNYHGAYGYIWCLDGSDWHAFDPMHGDWVYSMFDVPSRSVRFGASYTLVGSNGEILIYQTDINNGWMALWNSSRAVTGPATEFGAGSWRAEGQIIEDAGQRGQEWNVTIPTGLPGGISVTLQDRIIGTTAAGWIDMGDAPIEMWCLSIAPGHEGQLLWQTSWQPPLGDLTISYGTGSSEEGVFTLNGKETRQVWGFSTETGANLWGPTDSMNYLGIFGIGSAIAYGKLFVNAKMAGELNAYDVQTGQLEWSYTSGDPTNEVLWGNNWPVYPMFFTDGKIYLGHSEHSPVDPKSRGAPFICLNATTGEEIWRGDGLFRVTDWGGESIIGDSIIATYDSYDQMIYAIAKGPSAVSASAPNTAVSLGSSVIITGMVTDESPGTNSIEMNARFPYGVPAIADQYMSEWMRYVYKQFERPADAIGVPVRIQIVDPEGGYAWIGTATSDSYGNYQHSFIPQMKGTYTIIATFIGSEAYYGSTTTTHLVVDPAPAQVTIPPYPGYQGPSAQEVANSVVANLPADATPQQVAQAVINQMPAYPEQQEITIPEYTTMDIILAILVAIAIVIGIVILFRKK